MREKGFPDSKKEGGERVVSNSSQKNRNGAVPAYQEVLEGGDDQRAGLERRSGT